MSIILDALKKLDREKSSRRTGTANIALEILRPDHARPQKIPVYWVAIPLTAIVTIAITYAVIVQFGFLSKSSAPGPTKPPASGQQAAPAPMNSDASLKSPPPLLVTPPVPGQKAAPAPPSPEPVRDTRGEPSRTPHQTQDLSGKKSATTFPAKKVEQEVIPEEEYDEDYNVPEIAKPPIRQTPRPAQQAPKELSTTPPQLKLSAIVWYEESSKRFAMINGLIVNEGSVIEGVKVEEIYPDRVRFSHNGRQFEIAMVK
jgi:general secretion pathway protein B